MELIRRWIKVLCSVETQAYNMCLIIFSIGVFDVDCCDTCRSITVSRTRMVTGLSITRRLVTSLKWFVFFNVAVLIWTLVTRGVRRRCTSASIKVTSALWKCSSTSAVILACRWLKCQTNIYVHIHVLSYIYTEPDTDRAVLSACLPDTLWYCVRIAEHIMKIL